MLQPGPSSRRKAFSFLDLKAVRMLRVPPQRGDAALSLASAERSQNLPPIPAGSLRKAQSWLGELKGFYIARDLQKYHFQSDPASRHASWLMASISHNKGGLWEKLGEPWTMFWEPCPAWPQPNQHTNHIPGPNGTPCSCPDAWLYSALSNSSHLGRFFLTHFKVQKSTLTLQCPHSFYPVKP